MRDLRWCIPAGLGVGVVLALLSGGTFRQAQDGAWWGGWLAYSALLVPGLWMLAALWRWAGGGRRLAVIVAVALILRLACGVALTLLLPSFGNDNPEQNAGYLFYDAFKRDTQAWDLASSDRPITKAFRGRIFTSDQYGGLLASSALVYRYLSPDYHRQVLVILLGALVAAMGIPLLWRAAVEMTPLQPTSPPSPLPEGEGRRGEGGLALAAAWILAVYPESVLQGSAQMREPFLITFTACMLWGFLAIRRLHLPSGWAWLGGGLLGLILFSPGMALANLVILGGWLLIEGGKRRVSWLLGGGLVVVFVLALLSLSANWAQAAPGRGTLDVIVRWVQATLHWNIYSLDQSSGMVQYLFRSMPPGLRLPFIAGYGVLQPVLPSALIEPTIPLWRIVGTLRAAGWYALLPLLVYGVIAAFKTDDPAQRRLWLWLVATVWVWILISALRGGGDQWDNPRYRAILLPWQALVAGYAWVFWLGARDRWLPRILVLELIFLSTFTIWYAGRYYSLPVLNFWQYVVIVLLAGGGLLVADVLREQRGRPDKR